MDVTYYQRQILIGQQMIAGLQGDLDGREMQVDQLLRQNWEANRDATVSRNRAVLAERHARPRPAFCFQQSERPVFLFNDR